MSAAEAVTAPTLYHSPGSCSRVVLTALEQIGEPFEERALGLLRGDQRRPEYLALNPKGKVPLLVVAGVSITETPAIVDFLARRHPHAALLPGGGEAAAAAGLSDLIWCAGVLHPMAHRFFRPGVYSEVAPEGVKAAALDQLRLAAGEVAGRVDAGGFWYGAAWSAVDVYLCWVFSVSSVFGFPVDAYPALAAHRERVEARPAFQRALQRERAAVRREEIAMPAGITI